MSAATVTSKGQITVPKDIRERLGLRAGDRIAFREREDGSIVVEPETVSLMTLAGSVRSTVTGVTVVQMNEAIVAAAAQRIRRSPATKGSPKAPRRSPGHRR